MSEKTTRWTPEELAGMTGRTRTYTASGLVIIEPPEWEWMGHLCPIDEHCSDCVDQAADEAAAVAFGMMGMAFAIRENHGC